MRRLTNCRSSQRLAVLMTSLQMRSARYHEVEECMSDFYAITIERRLKHPVVAAITEHAYSELFA